jgi:hypothetical protein
MRFLLVALMALVLAACDLGASSPSAEPLQSVGTDTSASASASSDDDDDDDASASASASGSSETGMTCEEAFAALDVTALSGVTSLDAANDVLDDTIASCVDVAEWQAQITAIAPTLNLDDAEAFLAARCDESDLIDDSPICEELDD